PINGRIFTVSDIPNPGPHLSSLGPNFPVFGESIFPVPTDIGAGIPQNSWETVGRVDWNKSTNTQVYGRYAFFDEADFSGTIPARSFAGFSTGATSTDQNFLASVTHNWSQGLVTEFKVVYNRINTLQPLGAQPVVPGLFLFNATASLAGKNVALPGYLPFSGF